MYQQKPHLFCFNGLVIVIGKDNQMLPNVLAKERLGQTESHINTFSLLLLFFFSFKRHKMLFSQCEYVYEFVCMYLTVLYDMHSSPGRFLYYTSHPFFLLFYGV